MQDEIAAYDTPRKQSGRAIASLILGILSILGAGFLFLPPLLAVILGHMAVGDCNRDRMLEGKGLAITGLILGWITLAGWALLITFFGGMAFLSGFFQGS